MYTFRLNFIHIGLSQHLKIDLSKICEYIWIENIVSDSLDSSQDDWPWLQKEVLFTKRLLIKLETWERERVTEER